MPEYEFLIDNKKMNAVQAAAHLGISKAGMYRRIAAWPRERWLEPAPVEQTHALNGRDYTVKQLAKKVGITDVAMRRRIGAWPKRRWLEMPKDPAEMVLTLNGKTKTVKAWCKHLGRNPSTVYYRLRQGMSAEKALSEKRFYQGVYYPRRYLMTLEELIAKNKPKKANWDAPIPVGNVDYSLMKTIENLRSAGNSEADIFQKLRWAA